MATHPPDGVPGNVFDVGTLDGSGAAAERAPAERLVNLVVTLESSRRPRTFAEIRRDTKAYLQDDPESARRMFERDKDALRQLGVPIDTVDVPGSTVRGYVIDRSRWHLPDDISFSREEATALAVAMAVAGTPRDRRAMSRLLAGAPDPDEVSVPPVRLAFGEGTGAKLDRVAEAMTSRRPVEFSYRAVTGDEERRRVDPWTVGVRNGTAYLVGFDHDRGARRTFRVSRMTSRVRPVGEAGSFEPPADLDATAVLDAPLADGVDVTVAVAPIAVAELEQHGGHLVADDQDAADDGWREGRIPDADPLRLRGWLLAAADRVVVTAPTELRDRIMATLAALATTGEGQP